MTKFHQGKYQLINPDKYIGNAKEIVFRSSWELKFMKWCDTNPTIIQWNSEEMIIPYISPVDDRPHRYFVDFVIKYKNTKGELKVLMIEIKPEAQTKPPKPPKRKSKRYIQDCKTYLVNQAKWKAATQYAKQQGMDFQILTERHLGV